MEIALLILTIIAVILMGGVWLAISKMGSSLQTQQNQRISELTLSLEKRLGEQRTDFRDVALGHFESLHKTVQEALRQQQSGLEQRFDLLQKQNDIRLNEIRGSVEKRLQENLEQNFSAFKEMASSLTLLKSSADQMLKVSQQVSELNQILASPKLQGNFGEMALEQLLSDILPQGSFQLQARLAEGCQPDAVIRIQNTSLCIDAKFPKDRISALLDLSQDEDAIETARKEFFRVMREMISDVSKKYVRPELGTADQAFVFVPSESLYYETLKIAELGEHCRKMKVTIVSPNTLAATLYAVALAFRGYEMQRNVQIMVQTIAEMNKHFDGFRTDFINIGKRLDQAREDYAKASRDLERFDKTVVKIKEGGGELLNA